MCHLAVLHKEAYQEILGGFDKDLLKLRVQMLKSQPMFSMWANKSLIRLSYFFNDMHVKRKEFVYREGDKATDVFLIIYGELKFFKKLKVPNKNPN